MNEYFAPPKSSTALMRFSCMQFSCTASQSKLLARIFTITTHNDINAMCSKYTQGKKNKCTSASFTALSEILSNHFEFNFYYYCF